MAAATRPCEGDCGKNRGEKFFTSSRAKICNFCKRETSRKNLRAHRLKNVYELTQEEYDALYEAQGGCCAICKKPRKYLLHVEHDHAIEREHGVRVSIRGLVCKRDNGILRDARDDAQLLRACADYIDNPPAQAVLAALAA